MDKDRFYTDSKLLHNFDTVPDENSKSIKLG